MSYLFEGLIQLAILAMFIIGGFIIISRYRRTHPASLLDVLSIVEQTIKRWVADKQLDQATADRILQLISAEREAFRSPDKATEAIPAPVMVMQPQGPLSEAAAAISLPLPQAALPLPIGGSAQPPPPPPPLPIATSAAEVPVEEVPDNVPAPSAGSSLGASLLSLGTRRTLLFLGSFLLVVSSLVLVVFNWASFPPIVQLLLLAGVAGGIWAGGTWMRSKEDLAAAGKNLQTIGALLAPIVVFAAGRPGLLNLPLDSNLLLTSLGSMALYSLAAWRTSRQFYGFAAATALIAAVFSAARVLDLELNLQPPIFIISTMILLVVAHQLRQGGHKRMASGPFWVAQIVLALSIGFSAVILESPITYSYAATLGLGASAYILQALLRRDPRWLWICIPLLFGAVGYALASSNLSTMAQAGTFLALSILTFGLSVGIDRRSSGWSIQPLLLGLLYYGATLALSYTSLAIALYYPLLIGLGVTFVIVLKRGFFPIHPQLRELFALFVVFISTIFGTIWILALGEQFNLSDQIGGLLVLLLAGALLALAHSHLASYLPSMGLILRISGALISLFGAGLADSGIGFALLALIWSVEASLRRDLIWAGIGLGALNISLFRLLDQWQPLSGDSILLLSGGLMLSYGLGAAFLRGRNLKHWVLAGNFWALFAAAATLVLVLYRSLDYGAVRPLDIGALAAIAMLSAGLSYLWRQALLGFPAAIVASAAVLLAGDQSFFLDWSAPVGLIAYLLIILTVMWAASGFVLRRIAPGYALPYHVLAIVLLPAAPLFAGGASASLTIVYGCMAGLYALAIGVYRLRWPIGPALISLDLGLLHAAAWLLPGGSPSGAAWILAIAASIQALAALVIGGRSMALAASWRSDVYVAATIAALGALIFASSDSTALAAIAALFTVVLALIATREEIEAIAWSSLGVLTLSLIAAHDALTLGVAWNAAWLILEQLVVIGLGWAVSRFAFGQIWQRPTHLGPLALSGGTMILLPLITIDLNQGIMPITFGFAGMALILASTAVRKRAIAYAYAAGAAMVAAALCQLADWGFRNPQYYVVPAGIYLLVLGHGLRRMKLIPPAQLIEAGALTMMLGVTAGQALRNDNLIGQLLILCTEALLIAGYGMLMRLRIPFVGGLGFFIFGVSWMGLNAARFANQWVLLGLLGLLMVAAYVVLERHQERLRRTGVLWMQRLRTWS